MNRWVRNILLLLLLCCSLHAVAQTRIIDSLKNVVRTSVDNEQRLAAVYELNEQSINADSLLLYITLAEQLAPRSKDKNAAAMVAYCMAGYYGRKNMIDSGLAIMDALIARYKAKPNEKDLYLQFLFYRAKLFDRSNQYSKALAHLYEVVEIAAGQRDTLTMIQAKTGIGWVLIEMEQYAEALKWLYDAGSTSGDERYYRNYGALFSNMAVAFNGLGKKDSALLYINRAVADARRNENLLFLATALSMQAKIFVDNNMPALAEAPLQEVIGIRKQLDDPFYIVFDLSNLATYYARNNQPEKGIAICNEGIAIAKKMVLPSQLLMVYKALAENYKVAGREEDYGKTLEYIISLKDSFNNINSAKMLAEMHAANEARKQDRTIAEQRVNLARKNYLLFGSVLFAVMAGIIGWLAFKNYRRKQQLRMEVAIEKEKLIAAQAVKDAGEQERKRIAADLHDNLGAQANAILYSTELLQQESGAGPTLVADLHHTAKDMLTSLRETLWVLKNADVTAVDVWLRVISFTKQINRHYPQVRVATEGIAPVEQPMLSEQALNIVFIVQEAVNNAIRHASAETITVISAISRAHWKIEVRDDGKGFDLAVASKKQESYGLSNMAQRAGAAGLSLAINSASRQGTQLTLIVPLQKHNPNGVLQGTS